MQFVITAYDGKDMQEKRMRVRPRHLENMKGQSGSVLCAGGILDDEGRPIGSLLVMEAADRAQVDRYLADEPYVQEGVWQDIRVAPMNVVILNGETAGA